MDFNIVSLSIATVISTTLMTLFSYLVSFIRRKKFSEPELLNDLIRRWNKKTFSAVTPFIGWFIHYAVGFFFNFLYQGYWITTDSNPTLISGVIFGALAGVVGILGWKVAFALHSNPPLTDFKEYYLQLFFAHIVFGVSALVTLMQF
ncbi:MAG TPA: hypothetical protein VFZ52_13215 [Chryseolinea sp.]